MSRNHKKQQEENKGEEMRVVEMTWEEKRSRMLCHQCWLAGKKVVLAVKMIDEQGSLIIKGYEDVVTKGIRLGICEACLISLGLGKSDAILEELDQLSEQLTACLEKLGRVRRLMLDAVVCGICHVRIADSICNCGLNLCTHCEIAHRHTDSPQ
jgi:hypothetical protein